MILEEVRSVVPAASFHSFALHLANGSSIRIPHADFIRSHTIVDLFLVTKLEVSGSSQSTS
jgi:hypothetical protein